MRRERSGRTPSNKPLYLTGLLNQQWEDFSHLKDEKSDTNDFKSTTKFVSRCLEKLQKGDFALEENCGKNKCLFMLAVSKKRALDVRSSLKRRLPQLILLSQAKQLYKKYCQLKRPEELKITQQWLQKWCKEYKISLKFPNKRFSIPQAKRKRKLIQFLNKV